MYDNAKNSMLQVILFNTLNSKMGYEGVINKQ